MTRTLVLAPALTCARPAVGKDADEIVQDGLPQKGTGWSWSFIDEERWIRTLHRDPTEQ